MKVCEIDWEQRLWTVPKERMKTPKDHEVPLSTHALAILKAVIPKDASPDAYVFAGLKPGQPLGMNAMLHTLKAVYPGVTTHGAGPASEIGLANDKLPARRGGDGAGAQGWLRSGASLPPQDGVGETA